MKCKISCKILENSSMIDMSGLHSEPEYNEALNAFNNGVNKNKWKLFKPIQLKVSKNKCPVCECSLDAPISRHSASGITYLAATIDHYRPTDKALYPLLKYDHKNYLLMCSDCNAAYKGNKFPLHNSTPHRDTVAVSTSDITNEKPLIVNPIYDALLELFELVFRYSETGKKVLELAPKHNTGYLHDQAKETIKIFSLGKCEDPSYIHPNINVHTCRVTLLNDHFKKFFDFIIALIDGDMEKAFSEMKRYNLNNYGFFVFIKKRQFKNLI